MRSGTVPALLVAVWLLAISFGAMAQPRQGDVVFAVTGGSGGLYYTTWPGSMTSITGGLWLRACKTSFGNGSMLVARDGVSCLLQVTGSLGIDLQLR